MVLNFNIIFLNELAKYQTQKHLKEKYGRELISAWILIVYKDCLSIKIYPLFNLHGSEF